MDKPDISALRSTTDATMDSLRDLFTAHQAEMTALHVAQKAEWVKQLDQLVEAARVHNQACRDQLVAALVGDGLYWCPLRDRLVELDPKGPYYRYHEAVTATSFPGEGYYGDQKRIVKTQRLYVLPNLDFEVGQLLPLPNWDVIRLGSEWSYTCEEVLRTVPEEAEIIDIFRAYIYQGEVAPGVVEVADRYGIPPRLSVRRNYTAGSQFAISLVEITGFPLTFSL